MSLFSRIADEIRSQQVHRVSTAYGNFNVQGDDIEGGNTGEILRAFLWPDDTSFRSRATPETPAGPIVFDCVLSLKVDRTSSVSKRRIQRGRNISDHVHLDPIKITTDVIFTDTPIHEVPYFERSVDFYNQVISLHEKVTRATLSTKLGVFENMYPSSIQAPRNPGTGEAVRVLISWEKLETIDVTDGFALIPETGSADTGRNDGSDGDGDGDDGEGGDDEEDGFRPTSLLATFADGVTGRTGLPSGFEWFLPDSVEGR